MNVFTENAPAYTTFTAGFDDNLKSKINRQAYLTLQQQVKERFGTVKESKFYSFERYNNQDKVTYLTSFSQENVVAIVFIFDKNNKLVEFGLLPIQQNQQAQESAQQ